MKTIQKIKLHNFKRFENFTCEFDPELNIIIGDNEAGKSSILTAIDLVISGSRTKADTLGLDLLFNVDVIQRFLDSDKSYSNLPKMYAELYLCELNDMSTHGECNSLGLSCDGLQMICEPNQLLSREIIEILKQPESNFPFEFYNITYKTFSGENYSGYRKYIKHVLIDNSQISNDYATKEFVKSMYYSIVNTADKNKHHNEYRKHKETFRTSTLYTTNNQLTDYSFAIKNNSKANLETDLTLKEGDMFIENKGKGKQCFIKTDFALHKKDSTLDMVLIEEPENHLSHLNMKRLICKISESKRKQLFITTHNTLISTRLDLRNSILLNSNSLPAIALKDLPEGTARFFMKAPDNSIMEFVLSSRVILVEGDAEFILMEAFMNSLQITAHERSTVHIISIGGTSFKRYLDLAKLLKIKTAVIRDNDHDYKRKCIDNYTEYKEDFIRIFADQNLARYTFEVCLYQDNQTLCDTLFGLKRKTLPVLDYMLDNKADAAFELLDKQAEQVICPEYIKDAIEWIKK